MGPEVTLQLSVSVINSISGSLNSGIIKVLVEEKFKIKPCLLKNLAADKIELRAMLTLFGLKKRIH